MLYILCVAFYLLIEEMPNKPRVQLQVDIGKGVPVIISK